MNTKYINHLITKNDTFDSSNNDTFDSSNNNDLLIENININFNFSNYVNTKINNKYILRTNFMNNKIYTELYTELHNKKKTRYYRICKLLSKYTKIKIMPYI
jgi:hypothetical protein